MKDEERPLLPVSNGNAVLPDNSAFAHNTAVSVHSLSRGQSPRRPTFTKYRQNSISLQRPSQQNVPLYQRIIGSNYVSVTNPSNFESHFNYNAANSASSLRLPTEVDGNFDLESNIPPPSADSFPHRASILSTMRPNKLIGSFKPMANWLDLTCNNVDEVKSRKVRKYYEDQNYLIEKFQEIDNLLDAGKIHLNMLSKYDQSPNPGTVPMVPNESTDSKNSKTSRFNEHPGNFQDEGAQFLGYNPEEDSKDVVIAILVNFFINFLLLIGKIIVALLTNSMSVIASLVDSVLDFLSTFIIFIANKLSNTKNWQSEHAYPIGRSRLEPLGILIFSIIIIISFLQVGQESFKKLVYATPEERVPVEIGLNAVIIMVLTIAFKLGCWIWCASSKSSSVQALAQDAMTDIVFNSVSLLMPTLGHILNIWWFDSAGALALSIYIIISWSKTAFEHIDNLTGAVASPLDYKVILYLALRFAQPIKHITALKVYHAGDNLVVEIDVVFAMEEYDLNFRDIHDIAEALQYAIETLPMVERAFVHIDYMEGNYKGHLN